MEPVIIYTDAARNDVGAVRSFTLDLAFGADEQSFECSFSGVNLTGGELLYIDGTEYGGIVDQYTQATGSEVTKYIGRTWHGLLAGKVLVPPSGSDYYSVSGDANACIRSVLARVGLDAVLTGRATAAGFNVNYQFDRFCNAYEGLLKMCQSAGAVLMIARHDGITEVWAEQAATITDEADSDLIDFDVTRAHRVVNHLVCAGEGELQDRVIVDLYADANGNVSQTQTLFGADEVALYYNYSGADRDELIANGTKKLKEYQTNGGASIGSVGAGDWHVGNTLQVRDNRTGVMVTALIAKKIVKVERGVLTVDYEVGDHIAAEAASYSAELSGIAEQPVPLSADVLDGYAKLEQAPLLYGATAIPANADLDAYTDTGTYYASGTNAPTLANCPVTAGFKLIVERSMSTATYLRQTLAAYNSVLSYERTSTDGGATWGDWWREAPASTENATANRFLATPNGSAGLPSYRAIVNADLPTVDETHGGTGETTLQSSANALINALATGDNAEFGDGDAYVLTENTNGTHGAFYRRPIRNILNWVLSKLAPQSYNVLSLVTQTTAQQGNFTINSAMLYVSGHTAHLRVGFYVAAALTAGTEYSIATIGTEIRPIANCGASIGDRRAFGTVSSGTLYMRPEIAFAASTSTLYYYNAIYLLASAYSG